MGLASNWLMDAIERRGGPDAPESAPPPAFDPPHVDHPQDTIVATLPMKAHVSYAYNPNESAHGGGHYHIVTDASFIDGRIVRIPGDALCKRQARFWGLTAVDRRQVPTCPRCRAIAVRLGAKEA